MIVPGFQSRFIATQLAWWALCLLVFAAALFIPSALALRASEPQRRLHAADTFLLLHHYFWPALALLFAVATGVTIHMSHRVAGPLYRLRRVCEQVASGDLTVQARVRRGDYLVEEAAAFETMLVFLRAHIGAAQVCLAEAVARIPETEPEAQRAAADAPHIRGLVEQARDGLFVFRLASPPPPAASEHAPAVRVASAEPTPAARHRHDGFSVLEILVVAAIMGALAAIGAPRYLAALESARITKAIGDIKAIEKEVMIHFLTDGCYPATLADVGLDTLRDPWGNAYVYNVLTPKHGGCQACKDACVSIGKARKDRSLVPINSDFDLFSKGRDGKSTSPLTASASRDDIVRASDGAFVGLGADY